MNTMFKMEFEAFTYPIAFCFILFILSKLPPEVLVRRLKQS